MLPSAFVALAALPLNRSGKIDRAALARREPETSPAAAGGAPRSSIERRLAGLWQELLGRQAVGLDDNFFELGGDSILGVRVAAGAARAGLELTPALLHEHQTLGDLSRAAAEHLAAKLERWLEVPRPPLEPLPVDFPTGGSAARGSAAHDSTQTSTRTIRVGLTPERTAALQHGVESADSRLDPRLATHTLLVAACLDAFAAWTGRRRLGLCLDLADRDASALLLLDLEEVTSPDAVLQAIEEQLRAAAAENLGRVGALVDPGSDLARRVAALPQPQVRLVLGENEPQRAALDEALLTIRGRTRDDRLGVDWTYRESSFRRATVERLAEACLAALERWIEHLAAPSSRELTPEDFPDVDLDQGQLDKILQQLG